MRRNTPQRAALNRRVAPARKAFLEEKNRCAFCDLTPTEVHEIASGTAARPKAIAERATWLALCGTCHRAIHNVPGRFPLERQLAAKLLQDAGNLDIETVNRLRGRAPGAITLEDVAAWLRPL